MEHKILLYIKHKDNVKEETFKKLISRSTSSFKDKLG